MDEPWWKLPEQAHEVVLHGSGAEKIHFVYDDNARKYEVNKTFEGVLPNLERRWRETDSSWVREELGRYQSETPVRGLRRRAAEARGAGGEDRRPEHRRGLGAGDPAGARLVRERWRAS